MATKPIILFTFTFCFCSLQKNEWRKFRAPKGVQTPKGRRSHTATVFQDSLYIYGGYQDLKGSSSELWSFHFGKNFLFLSLFYMHSIYILLCYLHFLGKVFLDCCSCLLFVNPTENASKSANHKFHMIFVLVFDEKSTQFNVLMK